MVLLMTEEAEEKRIVTEFCHLLEKSKQLFNGLRDLPAYGHYKQWQSYFCRTFDIYTKLWKFQQQHRPTLDKIYCLKRWQIGEIANKIGQLYYQYYLRTSELHYLNESVAFYSAIKSRNYYASALGGGGGMKNGGSSTVINTAGGVGASSGVAGVGERSTNDFLVKKLRYLVRFTLAALLLGKKKLVKELLNELSDHIEDYSSCAEPEEHLEWTMIVNELVQFVDAEAPLTIITPENEEEEDERGNGVTCLSHQGQQWLTPSHRLNMSTCLSISTSTMATSSSATGTTDVLASPTTTQSSAVVVPARIHQLNIQEILIVGAKMEQAKFSELTIDMFRLMQTLEREPSPVQQQQCSGVGHSSGRKNTTGSGGSTGSGSEEQLSSTNNSTSISVGQYHLQNGDQHHQQGRSQHPQEKPNPYKHLLYRPTLEQLLVFVSCSSKWLGPDGALLIYISGDVVPASPSVAPIPPDTPSSADTNPFRPKPIAIPAIVNSVGGLYESGGIALGNTVGVTVKKDQQQTQRSSSDDGGPCSSSKNPSASVTPSSSTSRSHAKNQRKDKQCLYPGDLIPFTRKPLFLIIDSDNSHIFNELWSPFGSPLLILMSPMELPTCLQPSNPAGGSLFTHFLHDPLAAFGSINSISTINKSKWIQGQEILTKFLSEARRVYLEVENVLSKEAISNASVNIASGRMSNSTTLEFFSDDFLSVLVLRFIFCDIVLRMHKAFQCSSLRYFPRSSPNLTIQLQSYNPSGYSMLQSLVLELAQALVVEEFFTTIDNFSSE